MTLQVEQSRRACDAVARGEADCAIIGGDVPEDLAPVLQVWPSANRDSISITRLILTYSFPPALPAWFLPSFSYFCFSISLQCLLFITSALVAVLQPSTTRQALHQWRMLAMCCLTAEGGQDRLDDSRCLLNSQVTPYANDELVLIVPRHHELAKQGSIALEELYSLPLVSLNQVPALILVCDGLGPNSNFWAIFLLAAVRVA